jgi:hypothetical protein
VRAPSDKGRPIASRSPHGGDTIGKREQIMLSSLIRHPKAAAVVYVYDFTGAYNVCPADFRKPLVYDGATFMRKARLYEQPGLAAKSFSVLQPSGRRAFHSI